MTVYTYVGFALFPKKDAAPKSDKGKPDKEMTWKEGSNRVLNGALIGGGAGMLVGGVSSAIRFRKMVKQLMKANPHLTKEQAEDIVRKEVSVGKGVASGLSSGITAGGTIAYFGNDLKSLRHDHQKYKELKQQTQKKSGK